MAVAQHEPRRGPDMQSDTRFRMVAAIVNLGAALVHLIANIPSR